MKKTYRMAIQEAQNRLSSEGIEESNTDAWLLLSYVCNMDRTAYLMKSMDSISDEEYQRYMKCIDRRILREPLQYITGTQEFMGLTFNVNENVLIPRYDTEILVSEVIGLIGDKPLRVLDMCTGSGCIGISIASECPNVSIDMADISDKAIEVAEGNIQCNNIKNAKCIQSDLFSNIDEKYSIIVSNPPYIETKVIETLMPEVKEYEPVLALDGEGDGLEFYRRITRESVKYIENGGYLAYEIGCEQADAVSRIMMECGYTDIRVVRDLAGLDRVVIGKEYHNV